MNILYVTDCNPNASSFGNEQRTRLLYEALAQIGDVYIIQTAGITEEVSGKHWKFSPRRPQGIKRLINALWFRVVKAICPEGQAKYFPFYLLPDIRSFYPQVHFDIVVSRHLDLVNSLHLWRVAPLYVDLDDHPMEVFITRTLPAIPRWRRPLATLLQKFFIWNGLHGATGIWIANPSQESLVCRYGRIAILPNIPFSMPELQAASPRQEYILTVGRMDYAPNYEGIDYFIKEVWPQVHEAFPALRYLIVGKGVPKQLAEEWTHVPGVSVVGFVEDLNELYARTLATVVPVFSGGGTCIKVLESMAYSRVCISTEFGARGIPFSDIASGNIGLFVFRSANDFIELLGRVRSDLKWRELQEKEGREYVSAHYSKDKFFRQVHGLIGQSD